MKKFLILFVAFALTLTLAGCNGGGEELPEIPETVDMTNVDEFIGRPDVQYVDLRNFDDKMKSGYISGFEIIPFFDYLEATDVLVRTNSWTFEAAGLKDANALKALFDQDKTIFLMCAGGTRAGFVKDALESLDYENVYNIGGFGDYSGDNKVSGDGSYNLEVQLPLPATVDMTNIDMYMGRNDVQYVDLRNFDDKMKSGYLEGFEFIPFFDYLELEDILVRTNSWTFEAAGIKNEAALRGLFSTEKEIFLMCGSGTRAGFVLDALESLGYTNVRNIGGIGSYDGDYKVLGDGEYALNADVKGPYTPGTYFGYDPVGGYMTTIEINAHGGIANVIFDAISHGTTKQALGFDYGMKASYGNPDYEWFELANMLSDYVVANQGWKDIVLTETAIDAAWNINTVPHHFIDIDVTNSPDAVASVTIGAEGFVLSWNAAIAQATTAGTEGVVATTATPADWAAAHGPAFTDGVHVGFANGYTAIVTVEGGTIVDVWLDAQHGIDTDADTIKDTFNSKQAYDIAEYDMNYTLTDGVYVLDEGKLDWWMQADKLAEAILDAQGWDAAWVIIAGTNHDNFDLTDTDTADAVGGVSIGIENWKLAVEDAMTKAALPTE